MAKIQISRQDGESMLSILEAMKMSRTINVGRHAFEQLYARINLAVRSSDLFEVSADVEFGLDDPPADPKDESADVGPGELTAKGNQQYVLGEKRVIEGINHTWNGEHWQVDPSGELSWTLLQNSM